MLRFQIGLLTIDDTRPAQAIVNRNIHNRQWLGKRSFYDGFKGLNIFYRKFGERFAIDFNVLFRHGGNKPRVGRAVKTRSSIDARNPQGAEVAFLLPAVAVLILCGFIDSVLSSRQDISAIAPHSFGAFENFFTSRARGDGIFGSWHFRLEIRH